MAEDKKKQPELGTTELEMRPDDQEPEMAAVVPTSGPAPTLAAEPVAKPQSVLGTDVPAGQPIPTERMKQAEHLAADPNAEAQFRGKQDFHNTLRNFGEKEAANRASMLALNPNDPDYLKKLAAHQAEQGLLREGKAHYEQSHPWGTMESAHPGVFGKIGHAFGNIANAAGNIALGPGAMSMIPGTKASMSAREATGQAETEAGQKSAGEAATTAATEAEVPLRKAETKKAEAEAEVVGNPKPEDLQHEYAAAVSDAQKRGVDPASDPKVQQLQDAITAVQRQPVTREEKAEQEYQKAIQSGDHEAAERWLKIMRDIAAAKQAPQRPPQTLVVLPGGQTEVARPGMTLPEGTQNIGGFSTMGRPTTQMRNVNAQAQIASEGIPPVIAEIGRLKSQLGPAEGRWNEFMQGRVGMENPELAGLRADLLMVSSAVALAHARGRLPENLREEFDQAINAPHQTADNLISVLNHIKPWMDRMGTMGTGPSSTQGTTGSPSGGFATWKAQQGAH